MNKNRGILLVIAAIFVIGMGVTFATRRFISWSEGSPDTAMVTKMPGTVTGGAVSPPFTQAAASEAPAAEPAKDTPSENQETIESFASKVKMAPIAGDSSEDSATEKGNAPGEAAVKADSAAAPSITPLGPAESTTSGAGKDEKLKYYEKRLADLDAQVQKMHSDSSDSTTYSMKMMAEKELKLWNIEMNTIYGDIMKALEDDAKNKLESAQQAWMKTRDTKAQEAAEKYSGGSLEGVEYTASQAKSTRKRTYDLVKEYIDALPAEDKE